MFKEGLKKRDIFREDSGPQELGDFRIRLMKEKKDDSEPRTFDAVSDGWADLESRTS